MQIKIQAHSAKINHVCGYLYIDANMDKKQIMALMQSVAEQISGDDWRDIIDKIEEE